ncbi:hypothetical protein [Sinomicrobium sp. M5D2P9]
MSSYLPEKVFTVCTHNSGSGYGKLLTNPDARGQFTVIFKSKGKPLLTEVDKKLDGQFSCKTGWSSGVGTAAFGAGVVAGLAVAATVATIPVAGWIVGGAIALGCLAYGLFQMFKPKPTCSEMIGYQESFWINPHPSVTFDGHAAVTKQSMIQCKEGGFLLPFISESAAASAAEQIGSQNKKEITLTGVGSFIGGMTIGFTGGTSGIIGIGKSLMWGSLFSAAVYQPATDIQTLVIREGYEDDTDPYYDNMTGGSPDLADIITPAAPLPGPAQELLAEFTPVDEEGTASGWNLKTPYDRIQKIRTHLAEQRRNLLGVRGSEKMIAGLNARIAEIDRAIQTGKENGFSRNNNPIAAKVFDDARSGKYGNEVRNIFTNNSGNGRGMNRGSNYQNARENLRQNQSMQNRQNALSQYQSGASTNRTNIMTHSGMAGVSIVGLVLPFFTNAVSEGTLQIVAEAAAEDMANGISIMAKQH